MKDRALALAGLLAAAREGGRRPRTVLPHDDPDHVGSVVDRRNRSSEGAGERDTGRPWHTPGRTARGLQGPVMGVERVQAAMTPRHPDRVHVLDHAGIARREPVYPGPMRAPRLARYLLLAASVVACGPAPAPVAAPAPAPAAPRIEVDDSKEIAQPVVMEVTLPPKPSHPRATSRESECWREVALTGKHDADYAALIDKCGAPTGSLEYARPVRARLHRASNVSDVFKIRAKGGLCYRYFVVADESIHEIDIVIARNGNLVATHPERSSVAIIDSSKAWCEDADAEMELRLTVSGEGRGAYTFGVWARPR